MKKAVSDMACFEHYHPINRHGDRDEDAICAACDLTDALRELIDLHAFSLSDDADEPPCSEVASELAVWSEVETNLCELLADAASALLTHCGSRDFRNAGGIARKLVSLYITLDRLRAALEVEHPAECHE